MRSLALLVILTSLAVTGCSSDGGSSPPVDAAVADAKVFMDAPPTTTTNALGQLCPFMAGGGGTECPMGNACLQVTGVGTNTTTGYCSPDCMNSTAVCTTGYTGPAGGMPQCALSTMQGSPPNGCAIICTETPQCPTGMTCTQVPMQQVMICVPT